MQNALVLVSLTLFLTRAAGAFCLVPQPRLVCAEYFRSRAVVVAKLTRVRHVVPANDQDGFIYTLRAERVFRGSVGAVFRIYEENSSGRATFDWSVGQSYLLLLDYYKTSDAWGLDGCGNSGPIKDAVPTLKAIEALQANPGKGGFIHGSVHIDGVKIVAYGKGRSFETLSNNDGDFNLHVPPGDYRIRAIHPERTFSEADISYEHARRVHIENGGCAQIQFDSQLKSGP
jgi:hypothetical protein